MPIISDQLIFRLVKTGALPKDLEERLAFGSALAELVGYAGSVWLSIIKLQKLVKQEHDVAEQLQKLRKVRA
jgi:hypothetical protein